VARCRYKTIKRKLERGLLLLRRGKAVEGFRVLAELLREIEAEIAREESRAVEPGLGDLLAELYRDYEAARGQPYKEAWARDATILKRCLAWLRRAGVPEEKLREALRRLWGDFLSRYPVKALRGLPAFETELPVLFARGGAPVSTEFSRPVELSESTD